ncbi:MAG: formylglycine-generating enzyme family protein [Candidatus Cybelea sp.]
MTIEQQAPATPETMKLIPAGRFLMGSERFYPEESPVHEVEVESFWIDACTVTNREFSKFVRKTGYVTIAERPLNPADYPGALPGQLVPGALVFRATRGPVDLRDWSQWWEYVHGACWKHPEGPGSSIESRPDHPVVHVAYEDTEAYARWAGKRLPTEAEWEFAARGGLSGADFVWGNEMEPMGKPAANTWQGEFPWQNFVTDGYERTAPVGCFPPNGYGLYDMAGNVWEWTADWYVARRDAPASPCCGGRSQAQDIEGSYDPNQPQFRIPRKVLKGGSFLCAPNYCLRFRPAARSPQMIDTGMAHLGFRCVKDG